MIRTADAIDRLAPVTLAELEATAALLTRVDRKYLLAPSRLEDLLDRVESSHPGARDRRGPGLRLPQYIPRHA